MFIITTVLNYLLLSKAALRFLVKIKNTKFYQKVKFKLIVIQIMLYNDQHFSNKF